jgi:hypothetical protein
MAAIDGGILSGQSPTLEQGLQRAREMQQGGQAGQGRAGEGQAQPTQSTSPGAEPNVTEEEQAAYEAFVGNIGKLLYDRASMPAIVQSLQNAGPHPVSALSQTAASIIMRVEDSAEEEVGEQVDPEILLNAGRETVGALAEMAETIGVHQFADDELESAFLGAVDIYRAARQKQGKITDTGPFQQDLMRLKSADDAGALETEYPEIAQYGKHIQTQLTSGEDDGQ